MIFSLKMLSFLESKICTEQDWDTILIYWSKNISFAEWKKLLERPDDKKLVSTLRLATSRGRPLGSDAFIAKLETLLGSRLQALPIGRPAKIKRQKK